MLREIRIYGRLAKFLKQRVFKAEVGSAAEAVRFLLANFPHLEPELAQGHYRVSVGDYDLSIEELHDPAGQQVIKIVPVVAGAGGAVGQILAGVAILAAAVLLGPAGLVIGGLGAGVLGGTITTVAIGIGASLVLGGVAQLLSPVPTLETGAEQKDPRKSFSFSGIQNTSRQGTPVPIVYGETLVGSIVISAGIDTEQVTA